MCGIFGIISKKPIKFDYTTFCVLGVNNDSRGGDSCGIFIDGHYEYGVKENKYFECFIENNKFLKNLKSSTIAFGHCRKASVGKIDETTAQPVVITNSKGKAEYVLMHNGTIYNYEELAKKYIPKIDITGMTDSQVMARIFYHSGYDALGEYNGSAVFAIADYRYKKPKVLFFKGGSKDNKWSKKEEDERPFYFCIDTNKKELIFSSISTYLFPLRPNLKCWTLNCNFLTEFNGKDLITIKKIDRSNCYKSKTYNYEYQNFFTATYLITNAKENLYYVEGKKANGRLLLTNYGKIVKEGDNPTSKLREIYFWSGVALNSIVYYKFLSILYKDSKLPIKEFNVLFNNLIRYFSIDRIFKENGRWYKATSPTEKEIYSGRLCMITSTLSSEILDGDVTSAKYGMTYNDSFSILDSTKIDINFKKIREECMSLMKQHKSGQNMANAVES